MSDNFAYGLREIGTVSKSRNRENAHKSGDAWVLFASSAQSRGDCPLILECASCRDCALEANSTQACANVWKKRPTYETAACLRARYRTSVFM